MEIFNVVSELAPTLMKYSEINPKFIDIKIFNTDKVCDIKINSDKPEVSKALSEVLKLMAEISKSNPNCKVTVAEL